MPNFSKVNQVSAQHRLSQMFQKPPRGAHHTGRHERETWNARPWPSSTSRAYWGCEKEEGTLSFCYLLLQCGKFTVFLPIPVSSLIRLKWCKSAYMSLQVRVKIEHTILYVPKGKNKGNYLYSGLIPMPVISHLVLLVN